MGCLDLVSGSREELQARSVAGCCALVLAVDVERAAERAPRAAPELRVGVRSRGQEAFEPGGALDRFPDDPECLEPGGEVEATLGIMIQRPLQHGACIVDLGRHEIEVPRSGDVDDRPYPCAVGKFDQPVGLRPAQRVFRPGAA